MTDMQKRLAPAASDWCESSDQREATKYSANYSLWITILNVGTLSGRVGEVAEMLVCSKTDI